MKAIFAREVHTYYTTMTGWLFGAFLLLFSGIYTMALCLNGGYAQFEYVLGNMSFVFLIVTPILTMRVFAEERRQKTDQLLYSLPMGLSRVVLGKYCGLLAVLALPLAVTGLYPLILRLYGNVNLKVAYSALLGFFLLGAALLAVGMYLSSLTDSIVGSAAVCFVVVLVNYYLSALASYVPTGDVAALCALLFLSALAAFVVLHLTQSPLAGLAALAVCGGAVAAAWFLARDAFDGLLPALFNKLCLFESFYGFLDGVFDWTALCLLVSVCAVFTVLTVQSLEKRRWSE